jgi:hypothetical protein
MLLPVMLIKNVDATSMSCFVGKPDAGNTQ